MRNGRLAWLQFERHDPYTLEMRPETEKVLAELKTHAAGRQCSLRAKELASMIGLHRKIVSNALNWLVVEGKHPHVRRAREGKGSWYRYWWNEQRIVGLDQSIR